MYVYVFGGDLGDREFVVGGRDEVNVAVGDEAH